MRPTASQYAAALEEIIASSSMETALVVKNFFGVLHRRGDDMQASAVIGQLEARTAVKEGRISVTVVTARETTPEMRDFLVKKVAALFPDKRAELHFEIDAAVIGGALFRTDEMLYDATLRSAIRSLRKVLIK